MCTLGVQAVSYNHVGIVRSLKPRLIKQIFMYAAAHTQWCTTERDYVIPVKRHGRCWVMPAVDKTPANQGAIERGVY